MQTWGVTLAMGMLLNMIYWTIKLFHHQNQLAANSKYAAALPIK